MPLRVRVTCAGVELGSAEFALPSGLAHARLVQGLGYAMAFDAARSCGLQLSHTQHWPPVQGDFATRFAGQWEGERLAIENEVGQELAINNIVVMDLPRRERADVYVIADFRPDLARIEALLSAVRPDDWGRTKPLA